jgi:uncharacterized protein (TIGR02186 family)
MRRAAFFIAGMLFMASADGAIADTRGSDALIADLSSREIAITTGFAGTELLLFGTVDGDGDIIVVVRGPKRREIVRRKQRVAGVWITGRSVAFDDVPAFYFLASTRPLDKIAPAAVLAPQRIGADNLHIVPASRADVGRPGFRRALLRNKAQSGLYGESQGAIEVKGGRLFRTRVVFPSNVPTGQYSADVYLMRNGVIIGNQSTPLVVRKVGLEADIFQFAHQYSALYGIIAILIALGAGWLAGVVFRKA